VTDHIEDLLLADGARWRAGQPAPRDPDPALFRSRRRWPPLAAAAAVALVAGAATVVLTRPDPIPAPPAAGPDLTRWLVRDGDLVTLADMVVSVPGGAVEMCAAFTVDPGTNAPDGCTAGVVLIGANLSELSGRRAAGGTVSGVARVEGVYRAGTVTVDRQATGPAEEQEPGERTVVDCPRPPGGWSRPADPAAAGRALDAYVDAHPGDYLRATAGVLPQAPGGTAPVVSTTLDPAVARGRLAAVYGAPVCVVRGHSRAEVAAVAARARAAGLDGFEQDDRYVLRPVVVDEATLAALARVDGGTGALAVSPLVRPDP
jgi:hypothetical protein